MSIDRTISAILDSDDKAKAKVKALAAALLDGTVDGAACRTALGALEDSDKATVLEALEGATRKQPKLVDGRLFGVVVDALSDPAPRVRWEAARTVANVAGEHPRLLGKAVSPLLANTKHEGTVVRWATAKAIASLLRAGCDEGDLFAKARKLAKNEKDEGTRKVYKSAVAKRARR